MPKNKGETSVIETYLRVKPVKNSSSSKKEMDFSIHDVDKNICIFHKITPLKQSPTMNNSKYQPPKTFTQINKRKHAFQFNGIMDESSTQENVFRVVGTPTVQNVLDGFNSTVFAYGQTGSGKTFTMSGESERHEDKGLVPVTGGIKEASLRGIVPRAISMLFNKIAIQQKKHSNIIYKCSLSYLEVYNEKGYDLLSDSYESTEKAPKVSIMESENGKYQIRNLSTHVIRNEEDALKLLLLGGKNRAIGETKMNKLSSRSHCIVSIMVEKKNINTDTLVKSKLNLVDLAGSERNKYNTGQTLKESQHINVSLLYLQMVINALQDKKENKRTHVPYRNSMVTSILRDSLGGNCKTIMIGTISPDQVEESLSTCQFAERVSLVTNTAYINEEAKPEAIIQDMKYKIQCLRNEVKYLKSMNQEREETLSSQQLEQLKSSIRLYVNNTRMDKLDIGPVSSTKIHAAFSMFRQLCQVNKH